MMAIPHFVWEGAHGALYDDGAWAVFICCSTNFVNSLYHGLEFVFFLWDDQGDYIHHLFSYILVTMLWEIQQTQVPQLTISMRIVRNSSLTQSGLSTLLPFTI